MTASEAIRHITNELRSNARLRWGVWAIVGVIWFAAVLELRDQVGLVVREHRALGQKVAKAKTIAAQSEWLQRLDQARATQLAWEELVWREGTVGLAQATFQDWLAQAIIQAGLRGSQLTVASQGDEAAGNGTSAARDGKDLGNKHGLWKISAKLTFEFQPQSFHAFLERISASERRVVVESLVIRGVPNPRADVLLVAYFLKPLPAVGDRVAAQGGHR